MQPEWRCSACEAKGKLSGSSRASAASSARKSGAVSAARKEKKESSGAKRPRLTGHSNMAASVAGMILCCSLWAQEVWFYKRLPANGYLYQIMRSFGCHCCHATDALVAVVSLTDLWLLLSATVAADMLRIWQTRVLSVQGGTFDTSASSPKCGLVEEWH